MRKRSAAVADLDTEERDDLLDEEEDGERLIVALPIPVTRVQDADRDRLLTLLKERTPDPSILEERPPFLWQMIASNTNLDSYFTHMHRSTLENFAVEANVGISFQNAHRWYEQPLGKTLRGQFREKRGENPTRAVMDAYMLPGVEQEGIKTDHMIAQMRAGVISDVSVGFYGGKYLCDLCGGDYESYRECPHWLGFDYEDEKTGERQVATATIHEAHLSEVSAVYDGACPGAGVVKVYRAVESGTLPEELVRRYGGPHQLLDLASERYHVNVRSRRYYPSVTSVRGEEKRMPDKQTPEETGISPEWRVALREAGLDASLAPLAAFRAVWGDLVEQRAAAAEVETLRKKCAELAPLADAGRTYRADLIDQAITEGKRAYGTSFPEEQKRQSLERSSLEEIKCDLTLWKAAGDEKFKQGRQTTDGDPDPNRANGFVTPPTPARAFRA